ncbi:MAG: hypothetical protein HZB52_02390 [Chloroflexi bacterium]|nr:hypothetical protein [Chloroflexota bacterium]
MSPRARIILAVIGLVIICLACAALVYAFTPIQYVRQQIPVAPTLFSPP